MRLWLLVALYFGCIGVLVLFMRFEAFSILSASEENGATPNMIKIREGIATLVMFLLPSVIFANAAFPERLGYYKINRPVNWMPVVLGVFAILVGSFFIDMVYIWNKSLVTDPQIVAELEANEVATNFMLRMDGIGDLMLCLLVNALIPAVAEEMFFRGGVQQLLFEWLKKHHLAIFLSAAFFSFLHFDPTGFIVRFMLGIFIGYLFYWSGSLRLSIAAHFAFNGLQVVNYYWVQHYPESWWAKLETTYILGIISAVISLGALLTCRNLLQKNKAL